MLDRTCFFCFVTIDYCCCCCFSLVRKLIDFSWISLSETFLYFGVVFNERDWCNVKRSKRVLHFGFKEAFQVLYFFDI